MNKILFGNQEIIRLFVRANLITKSVCCWQWFKLQKMEQDKNWHAHNNCFEVPPAFLELIKQYLLDKQMNYSTLGSESRKVKQNYHDNVNQISKQLKTNNKAHKQTIWRQQSNFIWSFLIAVLRLHKKRWIAFLILGRELGNIIDDNAVSSINVFR